MEIGSGRYLFLSREDLQALDGTARIRYHQPEQQEVALEHGQEWEGSGTGYHAIVPDTDRFRMYYKSWNIPKGGNTDLPVVIAYAESRDGRHWEKPNLGFHNWKGSKRNNILLMDFGELGGCHDFSPFIDSRPGCPAEERYKAVGRPKETDGIAGFVSADGLRWQPVGKGVFFTEEEMAADTQNLAMWSPREEHYELYYRRNDGGVRQIARAVSKDFRNWKKEGMLSFADGGPTRAEQFYTSQIQHYYRSPNLRLGFPARYVDRGWLPGTDRLPSLEERKDRAQKQVRYGSAVTDTVLIYSRGGAPFRRMPEPFISPGLRTRDNWAYGDNYMAWPLIETESPEPDGGRELSIFATEGYFTGEANRLRRYRLRIDGFASLHADACGGTARTRTFSFSGSALSLNLATSAAGSLRIGILDDEGNPIPGFEIENCQEVFGDSLDYPVGWAGEPDLGSLAGRPVQMLIALREADLYSLEFA